MIEFVGRLTGSAFKYYKKTMIKTFQILLLIAFGIGMPIMLSVFNSIGSAVSCEGRTRSAQICAIKKVKDFGDYYAMTLPGICVIISGYFICEKDLLTNGTIERFEELFDGKIVRMSDHNQRRN